MWKRELRPMTRGETDELARLLKTLSGRQRRTSIAFTSACLAGTVPALYLLVSGIHDSLPPAARLGIVGLAALIGGFAGLRLAGRPDGETRWLCERLRQDLRQGLIEDIHGTATDAVKMGTAGTSKEGYLLDVGDGELMFVEARTWASDAPFDRFDEIFPSPEFHLVRAPRSGADLGFSCLGPRFAPPREIDPETAAVADVFLADGDVFGGRLSSAEADLRRFCRCALDPTDAAAAGEPMVTREDRS